ncbi:MAG: hypothetical protein VYE77_06595 [Planctomycetota bacterium]|nr:hypothetical protein [Planctomycetota bacterium]
MNPIHTLPSERPLPIPKTSTTPRRALAWLCLVALTGGWSACGTCTQSGQQPQVEEVSLTRVFQTIHVRQLQAEAKVHFESISASGLQASTNPEKAVGYLTITPPGWRTQRFQLEGNITAKGMATLLAELQGQLEALVTAHGAKVVGEIDPVVQNLPIASLMIALPRIAHTRGLPVELGSLVGFCLPYEQDGLRGAIDVIAAKTAPTEDGEHWFLGLVIHESVETS